MITIVFNLWVVELTSGQSSKLVYYCQALPQSKLIPRWGYAYHIAKLNSAQPSQAATGGSQISWAEISFIITAQPPTHPPGDSSFKAGNSPNSENFDKQ